MDSLLSSAGAGWRRLGLFHDSGRECMPLYKRQYGGGRTLPAMVVQANGFLRCRFYLSEGMVYFM